MNFNILIYNYLKFHIEIIYNKNYFHMNNICIFIVHFNSQAEASDNYD
jgi:hypothetical protein